jgi:glyceraldehyde 3-phosphate dehydrogenase
MKVALNGCGRIGRLVLRLLASGGGYYSGLECVAVNGTASVEQTVHMVKYDSVHGRFSGEISGGDGCLFLGSEGHRVAYFSERDPERLPWGDLGVDLVLECTGAFNSKEGSSRHLSSGAEYVLVSAPAKEADSTIVYGVNHDSFDRLSKVVSNGSCTTNCLAPVVKVVDDLWGVRSGFATTVHAMTNDQITVDGRHKDWRRGRAASLNMIPTSTGAARAVGLVLPHLAGKIDGAAVRVPTVNVSMVDVVFECREDVEEEIVRKSLREASGRKEWQGILGVTDEPLVSSDFITDSRSSIIDLSECKVVGDKMLRVLAWYDNEWGFSCRMLDVASYMGSVTGKR